ncbi:MAG: ATP-binding protein [Candidatus Micrarchaeia archaeon]
MLEKYSNKIGSSLLSNFFSLYYSDEAHMLRNQDSKGIFIGNTSRYSIPFIFNQDALFNSHIFVSGTTGAGKSYLMKTLIVKLLLFSETNIIIIDNTGEYKEIQKVMGLSEENLSNPKESLESALCFPQGQRLLYYNISSLPNEKEKVEAEGLLLSYILEAMRKRGTGSNSRVLVFLDEAWKLFSSAETLHALLREGRKYNMGFVLASQLIEDIDQKILSNMASVFIFRMQNKQSLMRIAKNYLLDNDKIEAIQELKQGSCIAIQLYKDKTINSFFVDRVCGVDALKTIKINLGGKLLEVSERELEKALEAIGAKKESLRLQEYTESGNAIEAPMLIKLLYNAGLDKYQILMFLRKLGISDDAIAEAFSIAVVKYASK